MTSDVPSLKQQLFLLPKQLLKAIADLRLAILLLLAIALFSIIGTVIEQGQTAAYYQTNYPEHPALFGFLTWKTIRAFGFDRVYRTWWFLSLLVLFGSSLTACTFKRQLPALKAARRWKYYTQVRQFEKLALSAELDRGSLDSLTPFLQQKNYKIFREGNALYARKGIVGRIGPIVVHASMLLVLIGSIIGAMSGFIAQEMVPSGESFKIQNIINAGPFATSQVPQDWGAVVNRFWIDYSAKGNIDQFYSDLSIVDQEGKELKRETIHVNQPLRYRGVTLYQTSWGIAGAEVQVNNSPIFRLPMAQLDTKGSGQLWGTWVPIKPDMSAGISLLTRDLQGTLLAYNVEGKLVGAVRVGSSIEIDGVTVKVRDIIGSTGLQIKADPGIPFVYAGFGFLMLGVAMSYFSHSQIWALQDGDRFYIGGRTNRAQVSFEREVFEILEQFNTEEETRAIDNSPAILEVK